MLRRFDKFKLRKVLPVIEKNTSSDMILGLQTRVSHIDCATAIDAERMEYCSLSNCDIEKPPEFRNDVTKFRLFLNCATVLFAVKLDFVASHTTCDWFVVNSSFEVIPDPPSPESGGVITVSIIHVHDN